MDEATKAMADGVLEAMRAEAQGQHFYLMAARTTGDQQGRRVFEQLAAEEREHLEFLRRQHRALVETGRPDAAARLGTAGVLSGDSPIFSPELSRRLGEAHFEMTALSVGIQLELASQTFYREQAEKAGDETVSGFFEALARWEAGHYAALVSQQETLKEDYWAAAGFSPM